MHSTLTILSPIIWCSFIDLPTCFRIVFNSYFI
nr:MAG TPA: hypothetical protein [Caudoviricetes sp.]